MIGLHEVVELCTEHGRWPAGTRGTVVETFSDGVMVEVVDERGRTLDLLSLPYESLRSVEAPKSATTA